MSCERLRELMPPPLAPQESGADAAWQAVEEAVGVRLPDDFRSYIALYGTGCVGGFLWVFNPFAENANLNLLRQVGRQLDALRLLRSQFGVQIPYPLFPDQGGLLPWGVTDNGNGLFWLTTGQPVTWPVVLSAAREPRFERFERPMTGFLADLVAGNLPSELLPAGCIDLSRLFVPA